jgi:hypothetical protein
MELSIDKHVHHILNLVMDLQIKMMKNDDGYFLYIYHGQFFY